VLEETAMFPALGKLLPSVGPKGFKAFARAGAKLWAQLRLHDRAGRPHAPGALQLLREVADEGGFDIDVMAYPDVMAGRDFALAQRSAQLPEPLRVAGVKLGIDGSPQGFTAWRDRPVLRAGRQLPEGLLRLCGNVTAEQANDAVDWAFEQRVQILAHASGERAQDMLIAAVDAATEKHGSRDRRAGADPRALHARGPDGLLRAAERDPVAVPDAHVLLGRLAPRPHRRPGARGEHLADRLGGEARAALHQHHDAPVAFPDSMRILDATVTRRSRSGDIIGPQQRVDVLTALKAMTIWAAYQAREEKPRARSRSGKLADFAILSQDPTAIDPEKLATLKVTETVKEGRTIFRRSMRQTSPRATRWRPAQPNCCVVSRPTAKCARSPATG
jgi:predicted amidohydrolase YtcJ